MEINPKREARRVGGKRLKDKLRDDEDVPSFTAYEKLTLDLGVARTDMEFEHQGDFLMVEKLDGSLSVRLHHKEAPSIDLDAIRRFTHTPFTKIFLSNAAQSNKEARLLIGRTDKFQPERRAREYHETADSTLWEDEEIPITGLITHYNIITSGYSSVMVMVETSAQMTVYPQFSHDGDNWYDYCIAGDNGGTAGTAISYTVTNCKKAIGITNLQAKYFRIVAYANAAATSSAYLSLQS